MKKGEKNLARAATENAPTGIGFRLDPDSREALLGRAAKRGVSIHELARIYVLEALHAQEEKALLEDGFGILHQEMRQLHLELGCMAYALLIGAGKVKEEQAKEWVQKNIPLAE